MVQAEGMHDLFAGVHAADCCVPCLGPPVDAHDREPSIATTLQSGCADINCSSRRAARPARVCCAWHVVTRQSSQRRIVVGARYDGSLAFECSSAVATAHRCCPEHVLGYTSLVKQWHGGLECIHDGHHQPLGGWYDVAGQRGLGIEERLQRWTSTLAERRL